MTTSRITLRMRYLMKCLRQKYQQMKQGDLLSLQMKETSEHMEKMMRERSKLKEKGHQSAK